jgi:hypothetical protein
MTTPTDDLLARAGYWLVGVPCESIEDGVDHDLIRDLATALRSQIAATDKAEAKVEARKEVDRRTMDLLAEATAERDRLAARVTRLGNEIATEIDTIVPDATYAGAQVIATLRALTAGDAR